MNKTWVMALILVVGIRAPFALATESSSSDPKSEIASECVSGAVDPDTDSLFRFRGKQFRNSDLDLNLRQAMYELDKRHYDERQRLLDTALWQAFLTDESRRRGVTRERVIEDTIDVSAPKEEELKAFYDANEARIGAPYDTVKGRVRQFLLEQRMLTQRDQLVAELKQGGDYQSLLIAPSPPVAVINTDGFPFKGDPLAPVEIVEFADYQCPHCKTAAETMRLLETRFGDKIKVIFMDFPINRSGISRRVAEGAYCAGLQGKYWDYHDAAFARQAQLSNNSPLEIAKWLRLDTDRFSECLEDEAARQRVASSESEAHRLGLNSTPSFFVNGKKVEAHHDMEKVLTEAIEAALKQAGS